MTLNKQTEASNISGSSTTLPVTKAISTRISIAIENQSPLNILTHVLELIRETKYRYKIEDFTIHELVDSQKMLKIVQEGKIDIIKTRLSNAIQENTRYSDLTQGATLDIADIDTLSNMSYREAREIELNINSMQSYVWQVSDTWTDIERVEEYLKNVIKVYYIQQALESFRNYKAMKDSYPKLVNPYLEHAILWYRLFVDLNWGYDFYLQPGVYQEIYYPIHKGQDYERSLKEIDDMSSALSNNI